VPTALAQSVVQPFVIGFFLTPCFEKMRNTEFKQLISKKIKNKN